MRAARRSEDLLSLTRGAVTAGIPRLGRDCLGAPRARRTGRGGSERSPPRARRRPGLAFSLETGLVLVLTDLTGRDCRWRRRAGGGGVSQRFDPGPGFPRPWAPVPEAVSR
ncbi:protein of unknown function [Methylorubrum extorquens]|uniref:Uncharacterized protein n=1 Tax=Methylorubrum extorquens TaxID=408 RepID=A0A2N9ATL6_METEX|nr:protein of unknown function [Methylorubrum extorquens]